jgi:flagellar hook-length control protein FliK
MELSSLTAATSSSSARNTDARSSASSNSANAPFADVMQRTANAEKPQRSGASENSAPRSTTSSANSQPGASGTSPDLASNGEETTASSSADVATSRTTQESRQAQGGPQGSDSASTDAQQILQSLETGDMAGLHAALEKLAGSKESGNTASDTAAADDDSASLDAQGLAALFAALPLTMTSTGSVTNGAGNTAGGSTATQAALQQMGLAATPAGDAGKPASIAQKALAAASQQPGTSTRVNAASQAGTGDASSDLDGKPGSLGNLVPGNLAPGTGTSSGQPMPQGDLTAGDRLDATLAANRDFGGLNSGASPGDRPDSGSLASLTASLSNAASAATPTASATPAAITTAVQSPQWPASFGQQVLQMHQRGDQQMSLRLHPQDLGPLSVTLTVQDQQAQLQILSAHAPVRAAVEAAIPQLRQALADSGIALGEAMVGDQGLFQQNQSSGDDQQRRASVPGGSLLTAAAIDNGDESALRQVDLTANGNISLYA